MKVLTMREPWASLLGEGYKTIETRSWATRYRGELYIHAGVTQIPKGDLRVAGLAGLLAGPLHYGAIFLKCTLADCVPIDEAFARRVEETDPGNYRCGDFTPGRYAWVLSDVTPIDPISAKGRLGIWDYENNHQKQQ